MDGILANWKTTAAGAATLLGALADVATQISTGHIDPNHLYLDATAIFGGLGLVFAKDSGAAQPAPMPKAPAATPARTAK